MSFNPLDPQTTDYLQWKRKQVLDLATLASSVASSVSTLTTDLGNLASSLGTLSTDLSTIGSKFAFLGPVNPCRVIVSGMTDPADLEGTEYATDANSRWAIWFDLTLLTTSPSDAKVRLTFRNELTTANVNPALGIFRRTENAVTEPATVTILSTTSLGEFSSNSYNHTIEYTIPSNKLQYMRLGFIRLKVCPGSTNPNGLALLGATLVLTA